MSHPSNISAQIVTDSVSESGNRITTFLLHYPRFIHAELMTHRLFSRNASSSRAIPTTNVLQQVSQFPATPEHWGKNQAGMQAYEELDVPIRAQAQQEWLLAMDSAIAHAGKMQELGCHKQIVNRISEPFQHINVLVTATEFANFFHLRNHPDAQPEIHMLADKMQELYEYTQPRELYEGEWHLPFLDIVKNQYKTRYYIEDNEVPLEQALRISASACAQVSYRKNDLSIEKADMIWNKLIFSTPCHASPIEHQATPMPDFTSLQSDGVSHMDKAGKLWSGNFKGWIQYRKLIEGEAVW